MATALFAQQGYAATTMTSIARAAGLRQPSVYYWFRSKEELLQATASVNRFSAAVVTALRACDASPAQKLYRLLFEDTRHICELGPLDYHEVERVAYQRPEEFREFWDDYRVLFDGIVDFIRDATSDRLFREQNPRVAGVAALSLNEGLQKLHRYHLGPSHEIGLPVPELDDPRTVAHQSASTTLAALLIDHGDLASVRRHAMALRLDIDADQKNSR